MTCNSCRTGVENRLSALPKVKMATVNLEKGEAVIEMLQHFPTSELQGALPEKYTLSKKESSNIINNAGREGNSAFEKAESYQEPEKSKFHQLTPLFIILLYISVTTLLLNYKSWNTTEAMLDFMGLFYIVFSFFKMLDLEGFPVSFQMYDPLAKRLPIYGKVYPFIETALGLMLLMRFEIEIALVATLVILGIITIGVTKTLMDKKAIQCACLGTALKLPMTEATFIENTIMIVMAVVMLIKLL